MVRSAAFTTQGRLHTKDIEAFLIPTLLSDTNLFLWVDLENPTPEETKFYLEDVFHFHPLSIEDCVTESHSPKVEEYTPKEDDLFTPYLFLVIHAVDYSRADGVFATNELNMFLGKNFLVTYHVRPIKGVAQVAERCLRSNVHIARAPDRLVYALLDVIVDNYKPALDELSLEIAAIEERIFRQPDGTVLNDILKIKKEVIHLRQIIGPQREVLARFAAGEFKLIRPHLVPYYRDVYDALYQINDLAQSYADSLTGILQVYLSMTANKTGELIKPLTLITVITTPVMVIGTWYGMNFENMPELARGYWVTAAVTLLSTTGIYLYFRHRKWL